MKFIEVLVEDTPACPGCAMRWKAETAPRMVRSLRYEEVPCEVTGMSQEGPVPAQAVTVEDSGGGTATLVWGGDLGLRLRPVGGGAEIAEPYLLLSPEDVDS